MSDIKWIKLSVEMFDDEKIKLIRKLPDGNNVLLVWIQMLIQAGKSNMSGYIMLSSDFPMTDEMFSTIYDMDINTVRHALKILQQFKMIDLDENKNMCISNWEKHQNVAGMERAKRLKSERNKRYYDKKKQEKELPFNQNEIKTSYKTEQAVTEEEVEIEEELDKELDIDNNNNNSVSNPFHLYQENFGPLSPIVSEDIGHYVDDVGKDLVIEAMKRAKFQQKSWTYAVSILNAWINKNIRTMDDVRADDVAFQNKRASGHKKPHERTTKEEEEAKRRSKEKWGF